MIFFSKFIRKINYFNIEFVFYCISLQYDIRKRFFRKTREGPTNNFKMKPEFFENFKSLFGYTSE